jgi:hypothetical protein
LKPTSLSLPTAAVALLTSAAFAIATLAQAPPAQPPSGGGAQPHHERSFPAPTNLKVLPKTMTGQEVHELMETWEGSLGVKCSTCHAANPNDIGPNGRPRLNFADDSKPFKATARLMYTMTEDINKNYVSKVPDVESKVTCGTCHRGHLDPEVFVLPPDDHDHFAPPLGQGTPAAPPAPPK